jgi:hypothetical protein
MNPDPFEQESGHHGNEEYRQEEGIIPSILQPLGLGHVSSDGGKNEAGEQCESCQIGEQRDEQIESALVDMEAEIRIHQDDDGRKKKDHEGPENQHMGDPRGSALEHSALQRNIPHEQFEPLPPIVGAGGVRLSPPPELVFLITPVRANTASDESQGVNEEFVR